MNVAWIAAHSEPSASYGQNLDIGLRFSIGASMKYLFSLFLFLALSTAQATPVRDQHVVADLIAQNISVQPGQPFWVGVKLTMDEHWHTYWTNPGDSGLGTTIVWDLPSGFTAGPIVWPYPHAIAVPPLVNYGYEDEVLLLTQITPPATLDATNVTLRAKVNWLMCEELCIPGKASLSLTLPAGDETPAENADLHATFQNAFNALPVDDADWRIEAKYSSSSIELQATLPEGALIGQSNLYFFAEAPNLIEPSAPQQVAWEGRTLRLTAARAADARELPARLAGILVAPTSWTPQRDARAVAIDAPFATSAAPANAAPIASSGTPMRVPVALFFAFVGGLILNLMPCVFPVLSLKIVHLVEQTRETKESAAKHALAFTAGVLFSMWALAILLLILRKSGATVGWAFQLSNPAFVLALTFLFLLIALNMFGVFEIGVALTRAGGVAQDRKGLAGSFFSGLLTTVAGAPCAGPLLGSVIGYALSQPANMAMLAFTAMGVGTAAPYALLSTNPKLLKALPKPGAWMETMKQLMAFPMLATAGWFASIYAKLHGGGDATFRIMTAFVLVGSAAWVFGKWTALHRRADVRWVARIAAVALLAFAIKIALKQSDLTVEKWSASKVADLRAAGRPVLVDFTAEWCAICQVNKRLALQNDEVIAKLQEKGVTLLVADWTDQNAEVTAGLEAFGRAAVPFYVLYGRDPAAEPQILPELLTPNILLEALDKIP
ncbi:MAG: thioredoxin family protein [Verrucomicrobia bacterium]|nr:thioredoxin family protein [Verrucomicrobiota bacterium]